MLIKKIKLSNFKCFDEVEVDLNDFNVLVGANASGKSNFLQAFKFLNDIQEYGLENAVSLQGGGDYLKNFNSEKNLVSLSFEILPLKNLFFFEGGRTPMHAIVLQKREITYEINLEVKDDKYRVINESLKIIGDIKEIEITKEILRESSSTLYDFVFECINSNGQIKVLTSEPKEIKLTKDNSISITPNMLSYLLNSKNEADLREKIPSHKSLLDYYNYPLKNIFSLQMYRFDNRIFRNASSVFGKAELEENGENIAIVIKKILENDEEKRRFINVVRDILPFILDFEVEEIYNRSLIFKALEVYHKKYVPSMLLSDGTITIIIMIVALFFEKKQMAIFEEPEHGIHPALIAKLMNLFYEASHDKQILITTHNPEVVKHTQLKDLLLISRKENGSSTIVRPNNSQAVHTFLDNELGIDEIFTQNLLDV